MEKFIVFFVIITFLSCKNTKSESNSHVIQNDDENGEITQLIINCPLEENNDEYIIFNNNDIQKISSELKVIVGNEIIYKMLFISDKYELTDYEFKIHSDLLNKNKTIFPWDKTVYPSKIYGTNNDCYPIRQPYSNNTVPMRSGGKDYIYDIKKDIFIKPDHNDYFIFGSDGTQYVMLSPEWSIINDMGSLYLIDKNHKFIAGDIVDYLLTEFSNTVFDDEYILETIKEINNSQVSFVALVTRYGMTINHAVSDNNGDEYISSSYFSTNSFFYLLNRLNKYFKVDISFYDEYNNGKSHPLVAKIYNSGFFFYSPYRIIFYDLKNHKIFGYKFSKNLSELTDGYDNYWIHLSDDNEKFYISLYDNKTWKIYVYGFF
jgi:hypothetical protein